MAASASSADTLAIAQRVLAAEAAGVAALAQELDPVELHKAIELLLAAKGRVVVSGMGKSGHVAAKIAATFASTGAPAQFVHPAEASHGDLGMLVQGDVVLMLSNSGETAELANMIAYTRRWSIPLIGVASNPNSTLLRASDARLVLPKAEEACPNRLAPTTSTTMTLALGDALAVALMERRSFQAEHFRDLHPGGALGARLSKVEDLMHGAGDLPLCPLDAPMSEVILTITRRSFGIAGVVDDAGRLVGVVTDGDLRMNMKGLLGRVAADVMSPSPKTIRPGALAEEALAQMNHHKITALFVAPRESDGPAAPIGLIHVHDCLRAGLR